MSKEQSDKADDPDRRRPASRPPRELVRGSVEETLNGLLEAEADRDCNARRYERSLETKAGKVTLKMPKLRQVPFETAIIERYRTSSNALPVGSVPVLHHEAGWVPAPPTDSMC